MTKPKIGYKVVKRFDKELRSFNATFPNDPDSVRYYKTKWTDHPDGQGPLALFKTLEDAKRLLRIYDRMSSGYEIWECEYIPSRSKKLHFVLNYLHEYYLSDLIYDFPGTVLARSVRLKKQLLTSREGAYKQWQP